MLNMSSRLKREVAEYGKNVENVQQTPRKPSSKSPSKTESSELPKKSLRFSLDVDSEDSEGNKPALELKNNDECSSVESPAKKRKKDIKMPKALGEMEEEIERHWDSKAEKSNLSVVNVKNILRSVITNKYVVDMVRQTVKEGGVTNMPFEPKLTRAKTKELLQQHTTAPLPPVIGYLTPIKPSTSEISPEIKLLIDKELSEDSSGEEYNPEHEVEQSEDEEKNDTSMVSDLDSLPPTPASIPAPLTPLQDWSQDGIFKVPQENVGQRTRSKLDLNKLPLECLEQAFVPPDITQDMYDQECDNPDWHEFLKEFKKPLSLNETLEDDVDNDPEYNILEDEQGITVEDKEEMRKDRAVKVSKKELNALMTELFEYTDILSSDDDNEVRTSETIAALEESIMKETQDRQKREEEAEKKEEEARGFHPNQRHLLAQQLRQHVQLMTQHFLQTYKHPSYHHYADICKTMLNTLCGLRKDKICCQQIDNMAAAMDTVAKWEELHSHPEAGDKIRKFVMEQLKIEKIKRSKKKKVEAKFPEELMRVVVESEAFLYPLMLPPKPFRITLLKAGRLSFTLHEDMLLAICLEQVTQLMENNKDEYKKRRLVDMTNLIYDICIPRSNPHSIAAHIRLLKCSKKINPVKSFFDTGKAPMILHYVIYVQQGVKLCDQPFQLLPEIWRNYLSKEYQKSSNTIQEANTISSSAVTENPITRTGTYDIKSTSSKPKKQDGTLNNIPKFNGQYSLKINKVKKAEGKYDPLKVKSVKSKVEHSLKLIGTEKTQDKRSSKVKHTVNCSNEASTQSVGDKTTEMNSITNVAGATKAKTELNFSHPDLLKKSEAKNGEENRVQNKGSLSKVTINDSKILSDSDLASNSFKDTRQSVLTNSFPNCAKSTSNTVSQDNSSISSDSLKAGCENYASESSKSQPSEHFLSVKSKTLSVHTTVKSPTRTISHCPKPPSTVKLKEPLNLTAKYNLNKARMKVPTSTKRSADLTNYKLRQA